MRGRPERRGPKALRRMGQGIAVTIVAVVMVVVVLVVVVVVVLVGVVVVVVRVHDVCRFGGGAVSHVASDTNQGRGCWQWVRSAEAKKNMQRKNITHNKN